MVDYESSRTYHLDDTSDDDTTVIGSDAGNARKCW